MDVLSKRQRSYCMSQIRGKGTKAEVILEWLLNDLGLRYKLHYKLPGKPDFTFLKQRLVVFVDGCFWHGCPIHGVMPKTNSAFWRSKLTGNSQRDIVNNRRLKKMGWKVIRVWEHEIKTDAMKAALRIFNNVMLR